MRRKSILGFHRTQLLLVAVLALITASASPASSHREAPFVTKHPKIDGTDFYMFSSYESARTGFVTLVANYLPLQDPYGGPNYFALDPNALYEIHIDNNGDAVEDITFQFRFTNSIQDLALDIGPSGQTKRISVPLRNIGQISAGNTGNLNVIESYTVKVVYGDRRSGTARNVTNANTSSAAFLKPADNFGDKSFSPTVQPYETYARTHIYPINIPDSAGTANVQGRLFVGQRKDPFKVNLGEVFDLVNITDPTGASGFNSEVDTLADKNVTSLCLEVPASLLTNGSDPVIGGWTTASLRQARVLNPRPPGSAARKPEAIGGAWLQQSRLGMPLVNELVIGLKDKDRFNASEPKDDAQFADYVTHPTLSALLEILFGSVGVRAPTSFPRTDLVTVFLTGIDGTNKTAATAEMLRLNTSTTPVVAASQSNLGVLGSDSAGFPNGRRPGDDVVDIALRVVMGFLLSSSEAPSRAIQFTDGVEVKATDFDSVFPYLKSPLKGSPAN